MALTRWDAAIRYAAWAALGLSGIAIACRAWGPISFPVRVNSPLNAEGVFALSGLLLWLARSGRVCEPRKNESPAWMAIASVLLLATAAFYGALRLYFLSDDFLLLGHAASAWRHPWIRFVTGGGDGFYRPIGYLFLGACHPWSGTDPLPWHLTGIVLHAINAALVLRLAATLGLSRLAAWTAAALFAIHGTRPESVVWLAGRFDLLAAFFVLLGLLAFLRSWHGLALVAMALAILSKESAYAFPVILIVFAAAGLARWRALVPYWLLAVLLGILRLFLFHGAGGYAGGLATFLSVVKILGFRLWAILFFPVNWAWTLSPVLALAIAIYIAALVWLFNAGVPLRSLALGMGITVAGALPAIQQLLIGSDLQKSRLLYLPSVGFCLLLGMAVERFRPRVAIAISAALLAGQLTLLLHNLGAWTNAAEEAHRACASAAKGVSIEQPPGSLYGVYFFANGFAECVEMEKHKLRP